LYSHLGVSKFMKTKIYIRERNKHSPEQQEPRFRIVAITGPRSEIKFDASHFRKNELEAIVADVGAEIVLLEPMDECEHGHQRQ